MSCCSENSLLMLTIKRTVVGNFIYLKFISSCVYYHLFYEKNHQNNCLSVSETLKNNYEHLCTASTLACAMFSPIFVLPSITALDKLMALVDILFDLSIIYVYIYM